MYVVEHPFPECEKCENIFDCPQPDVSTDFMGHPVPPEVCPHPLKIVLTRKDVKRD